MVETFLKLDLCSTLCQLQSSSSSSTVNNILHFLGNSAAEVFTALQIRQRKKQRSNGETAPLAFARTHLYHPYHSNRPHTTNRQPSVTNHSRNQDTIINTSVKNFLSTRNYRRSCRCKNKYKHCRRHNRNIEIPLRTGHCCCR